MDSEACRPPSRGGEAVTRRPHKPKNACSNQACATKMQAGTMTVDYKHARDISDVDFLSAVDVASRRWPSVGVATHWDVARVLGGLPVGQYCDDVPGVPWKVVLAKFRRCEGRGLVTGCDCGCRGDFELTDKGRDLIHGVRSSVG